MKMNNLRSESSYKQLVGMHYLYDFFVNAARSKGTVGGKEGRPGVRAVVALKGVSVASHSSYDARRMVPRSSIILTQSSSSSGVKMLR
jgi:hypothetical protein